jgi:DNA adenine methylase
MPEVNAIPVPFVKWAGGKNRIVSNILQRVPSRFDHYYEPFLGGAALFFAISQRTTVRFTAYLSDTNEELINAYRTVLDDPENLIDKLSIIQEEYDIAADKSLYYYVKRHEKPRTNVDKAARFVFLNKTCYNGLYRVNSKGEFNVPFGRYAKPRLCDPQNILAISRLLRESRASIQVLDFEKAVLNADKGDLVYFDPPYQPVSQTSSFTGYTSAGFSKDDQLALSRVFKRLVSKGCHVILSNSSTRLVEELYSEFGHDVIRVNRAINSVGSRRTGFTELLIYNRNQA